MCIRDRNGIWAFLLKSENRKNETPATPISFKKALLSTSETCLLYTSDAADERSSVDLGGRRIIKKKKHNMHNSSETIRINQDNHNTHKEH